MTSAADLQESVLRNWDAGNDSRQVSLIRTSRDDLICEVFDRVNKILARRMIKIPTTTTTADQYAAHLARNTHPILSSGSHSQVAALVNNCLTRIQKWSYKERKQNGSLEDMEVFLFQNPQGKRVWIAMDLLNNQLQSWLPKSGDVIRQLDYLSVPSTPT